MAAKKKNIIIVSLSVVFVCSLTGAFFAHRYYNYIYAPNVAVAEGETYMYIPTGSDYTDVLDSLTAAALLIDETSFRWVAEQKDYAERVKPGRYRITDGMSNNELVNMLRSGRQSAVNVTFNNVRTLPDLAAKLATIIEADSLQLIQAFTDSELIASYGFDSHTFACMFLPNTYEFYWNTSARQFTDRMKQEYDVFWTEERIAKAKESEYPMTQVQVSILASIVEQETRMNDEKPRVAGVYINRLKKGMLLQADPTVIFAANDFSIQRVLFSHLEIDSPYNTYKYQGLPPGPICIPSVTSIEAVLDYEKHEYLYFCAKDDFSGYHSFAKTLQQHNANARKFHRALNQRQIR